MDFERIKKKFIKNGASEVFFLNTNEQFIYFGNELFKIPLYKAIDSEIIIVVYNEPIYTDEIWLSLSYRFDLNGIFNIFSKSNDKTVEAITTLNGNYRVFTGPYKLPYNLIILEKRKT